MIHQTSRSRTASLLRFVGYFVWSSHCCIFFRSLCFTTFFRAPSMCCTYVVRHLSNKQKRERRTDYNTCWHADRKDPPPPIFGTLPPVGGDLPPFWSSAKSHTVRSAIGTRQYFRQSINTVTESETKPKHSASCCIQSFSRQTRCTSVQQTSSTQSKERGKRKEKRKKKVCTYTSQVVVQNFTKGRKMRLLAKGGQNPTKSKSQSCQSSSKKKNNNNTIYGSMFAWLSFTPFAC